MISNANQSIAMQLNNVEIIQMQQQWIVEFKLLKKWFSVLGLNDFLVKKCSYKKHNNLLVVLKGLCLGGYWIK